MSPLIKRGSVRIVVAVLTAALVAVPGVDPAAVAADQGSMQSRAHHARPWSVPLITAAHEAERRDHFLVPRSHRRQRSVDDSFNLEGGASTTVYFAFDSAALRPRALTRLWSFAASLSDGTLLDVAGHTDWIGTAEYNRTLARQRAGAIANALRAHGMRTRLWVYGESCPRETDRTKEGRDLPSARRLNRRVVVSVSSGQTPRRVQRCARSSGTQG